MATAILSTFDKQAMTFLKKTKTSIEVRFLEHAKHFHTDTEERDIYEVTMRRGLRSFVVRFGQSIARSATKSLLVKEKHVQEEMAKLFRASPALIQQLKDECILLRKNVEQPSDYEILASLQKENPMSFEDFCSDYGYEEDSRSAERIYKAVKEEWLNVERLWTDAEIEQLQEIQ